MKRDTKLYNLIVPIWLIWLFPPIIFAVLPANFLFDSFILFVGLKICKITNKKKIYKKTILKIWGIGFLSDIIGAILLLICHATSLGQWWDEIRLAILVNPFENPFSLFITLLVIGLSGFIIFLLNFHFSFKKLNLSDREKKILSIIIAVLTAPYLYLIPLTAFE